MNNRKHKAVALALAAILTVGASALKSEASMRYYPASEAAEAEYISNNARARQYLSLSTPPTKNVWSYERPTVTVGGKSLAVKGLLVGKTDYIPIRAAAEALGAKYSYDTKSSTATLSADGLYMTIGSGCYVAYANDRALFSLSPSVIMNDGRMYIPVEIFAKATGMSVERTTGYIRLSGSFKPITHARYFYRDDEVFWLARIIHAESSGEPLLGQIAVGDVVLNRVKSPLYPNTIYSVIFDRKWGVQFSPILNGTIYNTPSYLSTLAAKICLEGYEVTGGALFFLEPRLSSSSWIPNSREYVFTVGRHDFYK